MMKMIDDNVYNSPQAPIPAGLFIICAYAPLTLWSLCNVITSYNVEAAGILESFNNNRLHSLWQAHTLPILQLFQTNG